MRVPYSLTDLRLVPPRPRALGARLVPDVRVYPEGQVLGVDVLDQGHNPRRELFGLPIQLASLRVSRRPRV